MATTTPRIGLTKPDGTDLVDIAVLNTNFDKIDSNIASTKIQSTKPTTANAGDLWWDSDTGTLYLYYVDANSSQWVAATSDPVNIGVVANQTERDAQYPTPAQGMSVYRTDLGVTQRYYGLFNSSTNPGGMNSAGWYNTEKTAGLVPVSPTGVVAVSGSATIDAIGKVSFTGCTAITLLNVFTDKYKYYRVVIETGKAANTDSGLQLRLATSDGTQITTNYSAGFTGYYWGASNMVYSASTTAVYLTYNYYTRADAIVELINPSLASVTSIKWQAMGSNGAAGISVTGAGEQSNATAYPSVTILTTASNILGNVIVYGYND